ncbi:MAG TPA: efflux RND transporter periplasmic adaptor subunit [bacterium]|nr:efflux RND transporter periplasmic adaptor subunit [bacterium]
MKELKIKEFLHKVVPQQKSTALFWGIIIVFAFAAGFLISNGGSSDKAGHQDHSITEQPEIDFWTCSMHPNVKQPNPGQCPICGMDLIPVSSGKLEEEGPREIFLSEYAQKLAEIETSPAERKYVEKETQMVGKIEYDETRLSYITARAPGRIDKLLVNYTGIAVKKGAQLAQIYSPEILSTHQELLESLKAVKSLDDSTDPYLRSATLIQLNSVRERLRLWGLPPSQIDEMEKSHAPSDQVTIYSPISGVVVHKNALEGMYVETGTKIFTIADLSQLWVKMDAYESDITWLRYGQDVQFTTEAYPGEIFKGKIAFIDPVVDPKTRTIKIRVNVNNPDGKLKPEMLVRGFVYSKLNSSNKVINPELSGKWISPMHPEIIKSAPGKCDICGMDLVSAESLGYANSQEIEKSAPLLIPASAPLITGKRAVVYVEVENKTGVYEGREIELGPRVGDYYIVKSGLHQGERVVVKGNFKIDSAVQIQSKPSMMNPEGGQQMTGHQHHGEVSQKTTTPQKTKKVEAIPEIFKRQLDDVYQNYFYIHYSLSRDEFEKLSRLADSLLFSLENVNMNLLKNESHLTWMEMLEKVKNSVIKVKNGANIEQARHGFDDLSQVMIQVAEMFGSLQYSLLVYHCPMAFDNRGADWLQNRQGVENPYFGSSMFGCGELKQNLTLSSNQKTTRGHEHE